MRGRTAAAATQEKKTATVIDPVLFVVGLKKDFKSNIPVLRNCLILNAVPALGSKVFFYAAPAASL
jgi:hypothetical protein